MTIALSIIIAYIIGSFPTAYIVTRLRKGVDIREIGSRNMGAMNVFYKVGFVEGMLVLLTDVGKGVLAVAISHFIGGGELAEYLAGAAVLTGHNFPVFLKFHGGKGGATCIGVLIYLMPWGIPIYLAIFGLGLLITRYPTLSYSIAFLCFPFIGWLIYDKVALAIYTLGLLLLLVLRYIPRVKEMRAKGGSWQRVFHRKDLKDRL